MEDSIYEAKQQEGQRGAPKQVYTSTFQCDGSQLDQCCKQNNKPVHEELADFFASIGENKLGADTRKQNN